MTRYWAMPRRRMTPKRFIRRATHFIGFLIYWAVALSLGELAFLCVTFLCVKLS